MSHKLDSFTRSYLETALWSSTDNSDDQGGEPLDKNYTIEDLASEALAEAIKDCAAFQKANFELYSDSETAGHDFWLTRNGHGCGFWDGDYPEPQASKLTEASKAYGEVNLYVGDDGIIYSYSG